mmetsp:Transcript_33243/g.102635  ORF Transcript_33243/g.102635 Transcript_33243/m.102635 type:complete len:109 (-) Transcript_33243:81-407(-)
MLRRLTQSAARCRVATVSPISTVRGAGTAGENSSDTTGSDRPHKLPFALEDVPVEMLRHPYWDSGDGISPYTMPWDLLLTHEEGEAPENLANIFADDAALINGEYLRQ